MAKGIWTVLIQGTGPYQNNSPGSELSDVDKLVARFLENLFAQGHTIQVSNFSPTQPSPVVISTAHFSGRGVVIDNS